MSKTLKDGVTAVAYTGGTAETYENVPTSAAGTTYVNTDAGATNGVFESVRLVGRQGIVTDTTVTKFKAQCVVTMPVIDATTGEVRYNTMRVELTTDPRDHATLQEELRRRGSQVLTESAFASLWTIGQE